MEAAKSEGDPHLTAESSAGRDHFLLQAPKDRRTCLTIAIPEDREGETSVASQSDHSPSQMADSPLQTPRQPSVHTPKDPPAAPRLAPSVPKVSLSSKLHGQHQLSPGKSPGTSPGISPLPSPFPRAAMPSASPSGQRPPFSPRAQSKSRQQAGAPPHAQGSGPVLSPSALMSEAPVPCVFPSRSTRAMTAAVSPSPSPTIPLAFSRFSAANPDRVHLEPSSEAPGVNPGDAGDAADVAGSSSLAHEPN